MPDEVSGQLYLLLSEHSFLGDQNESHLQDGSRNQISQGLWHHPQWPQTSKCTAQVYGNKKTRIFLPETDWLRIVSGNTSQRQEENFTWVQEGVYCALRSSWTGNIEPLQREDRRLQFRSDDHRIRVRVFPFGDGEAGKIGLQQRFWRAVPKIDDDCSLAAEIVFLPWGDAAALPIGSEVHPAKQVIPSYNRLVHHYLANNPADPVECGCHSAQIIELRLGGLICFV